MKQQIKKLFYLLLLTVFILWIMPQAVYALPEFKINITSKFDDAKFLAEIRKTLGIGPSDAVYSNEVSKIISLDVAGKGILSLAGIEYATGLESLHCENNNLTALDMSSCPKLKILHCWKNKLTVLNVSENPALKELYCDQNKLAKIDVSKNADLQILNCFTNKLTKLDVRKNPKLEVLRLYDNKISALDLSKNTALDRLNCGVNLLTVLDVRKNINLSALSCYENQLTVLDLRKNPKLKELYCQANYLPSKGAIMGLNESQLINFDYDPQAPVPSEPKNLKAFTGNGEVTLSWEMPVYGGSSTITGFEVSSNDGGAWITAGTETGYTFTGLTNGQSYTFRVRAVNSAGTGLNSAIKSAPEEKRETIDFTLSFDTGGGSIINSISKPEGTTVDLLEFRPTRDGFDFDGWYEDALLKNGISSVRLGEDTTVYAKWLEISDIGGQQYTESDVEIQTVLDAAEQYTNDRQGAGDLNVWLIAGIALAVLLCGGAALVLVRGRKRSSRPQKSDSE
ncbi:MAG: InlB B-repeat-containing protein [Christensenellales bacterium]